MPKAVRFDATCILHRLRILSDPPLGGIVLLAVIVYCNPRIADLLVFDRKAILNGEFWRLATSPMMHFSASHLFWDALVFAVAGVAVQASGFRGLWLVCILATIIPGLVFLLSFPELERYGGLSGWATGAVTYCFLCSMYNPKNNRLLWLAILAGMGSKIFIETATGTPLFAQVAIIPFRVLPSVHLVGFLGAIVTMLWLSSKTCKPL